LKKPRFNIIDAVVLLALAAVVAGGVWYFTSVSVEANVYVDFTVEFRNQPEGIEDFIEIGGEMRDSVRNYFLGHVVDFNVVPAHILNFDSTTNTFVQEIIPERTDIYLTIRGRGFESDSEITVEGQRVTIGRQMFIRGRGFVNTGFITELRTTPIIEGGE